MSEDLVFEAKHLEKKRKSIPSPSNSWPRKTVKGILMKDFEIGSENLSPALSLDEKSLEIPKKIHEKDPSSCSITSSGGNIQPLL